MKRTNRGWFHIFFGIYACLATVAAASEYNGVEVQSIGKGSVLEKTGIQSGDILLEASSVSQKATPFSNPFDFLQFLIEEVPKGSVNLELMRKNRPMVMKIPAGMWDINVNFRMDPATRDEYDRAAGLIQDKQNKEGASLLRSLAKKFEHDEPIRAVWLLMKSAEASLTNSDMQAAISDYDRGIKISEETGQTFAAFWLHALKGDLLRDNLKFDEAEKSYNSAMKLVDIRGKPLTFAFIKIKQGDLDYERRKMPESNEHYKSLVSLVQEVAPHSLLMASVFSKLANTFLYLGDPDSSEEFHKKGLALKEELAPGTDTLASSYNSLGLVAYYRGDTDLAESYYRKNLAINQIIAPDTMTLAYTINNLGLVYHSRGDLFEAEKLYRKGFEITERKAPNSMDHATGYLYLGIVSHERGDLSSAENYYRKSLSINEALFPGSMEISNAYHNLGMLLQERADLDLAEDYYRKAYAIRQKVAPGGMDHASSVESLANLAWARLDLIEAERLHQEALSIRRKTATENDSIALSIYNLAVLARERGDLRRSLELHQQALSIRQKVSPDSTNIANSYLELALIAKLNNSLNTAEELALKALAIWNRLAGGTVREAQTYHFLAGLYANRGDQAKALEYSLQAVSSFESQRARLGGSELTKSSFAAQYADLYLDAVEALIRSGATERAFHMLERYRARGLLSMIAERDLIFSVDVPEELEIERKRADSEYDHVQSSLNEAGANSDPKKVESLLAKLRQIKERQTEIAARIRKTSPQYASLQYPEPLDVAAVKKVLEPGTLLLAFSIGKSGGHLFVLSNENLEVHDIDVSRDQIQEEVRTFIRLIKRIDPTKQETVSLIETGRSLFSTLLEPAWSRIQESTRLLIIPDGPLHLLPFSALVIPKKYVPSQQHRPAYLVELKPLHSALSGTLFAQLKRDKEEKHAQMEFIGFGDPLYPNVNRMEDPEVQRLTRNFLWANLPASRIEIESIASLFAGNSRIYLGKDATESRVKEGSSGSRYLHFACHAVMDDRFPLNSALLLAPQESAGGYSADNGLLQAWEIFERLRIESDLVVLSACSTGLGKDLGGEGLVGLTQAFLYAGASSVLSSLWNVEDASTASLMKHFYTNLKQGASKIEALRAAQMELILKQSEWSAPFYWAAFQLNGDWD